MCPDSELLSVFLDGELPSPWDKRMEKHLSICSECTEQLNILKGIKNQMLQEAKSIDPSEAMARISQRLENLPHRTSEGANWPSRLKTHLKTHLPNIAPLFRPIHVPLPLVALTAVLIFVMGLSLFQNTQGSLSSNQTIATEQSNMPAMDIPSVLKYLEGRDAGQRIMVIQLPETSTFSPLGEPAFIKAADYSSRKKK